MLGPLDSGHFQNCTAGVMMIHCGHLWLKKCKWTSKKWLVYLFLQILTQKYFKIFPCRVTFKLVHCCTSAMASTSLILTLREIVPLVDCRGLHRFAYIFHPCNHFNEYIYYCIDIHYRAAGNTARKRLSCCLFLKMKTLLGYRCCCLGNLVTLTLLSTLFTTRFIKCVAAGN